MLSGGDIVCDQRLTKDAAFLQFAGAFADLESIVIDLDLVVTLLEFAVLFPGELNGFGLASFEVDRNLSGVNLVAFVTGSEGAGTQCGNGDGLAVGTGDADINVGLAGLCDTVSYVETDHQLVHTTGGSGFFVFAVLLLVHRSDADIRGIERRSDVYFLAQVCIRCRGGLQVVGQLFFVLGQLLFVGGQLLVVLGELSYLLFEAAYLVIEFLDEVFGFPLFGFCEVVLAEQAADLLLEVSDLAVSFVDGSGQLIVGLSRSGPAAVFGPVPVCCYSRANSPRFRGNLQPVSR
jgi:hypothetical protein